MNRIGFPGGLPSAASPTTATTRWPVASPSKTEVGRRHGPWRNLDAAASASLAWLNWRKRCRLLEPIGCIPPAEAEANHRRQPASQALPA